MNEAIGDLMGSLGWSGLGFALGYFIGQMRAEVHEIKQTVCEHPDHDHDPPPPVVTPLKSGDPMPKRLLRKNFSVNVLVGGLIILLSLWTVVSGARNSAADTAQAKCFTEYNVQFIKAYQARALAADKDRSSFNKLILTLQDRDPQVRRVAFDKYVEEVRDTDAQRQQSPLPQPPDPTKFCEQK